MKHRDITWRLLTPSNPFRQDWNPPFAFSLASYDRFLSNGWLPSEVCVPSSVFFTEDSSYATPAALWLPIHSDLTLKDNQCCKNGTRVCLWGLRAPVTDAELSSCLRGCVETLERNVFFLHLLRRQTEEHLNDMQPKKRQLVDSFEHWKLKKVNIPIKAQIGECKLATLHASPGIITAN